MTPFRALRPGWSVRAAAYLSAIVLIEFVLSAGIRQYRRSASQRDLREAELAQEPYRGTPWGRQYWNELAQYSARWDPYFLYRVGTMRGQFINVTDGVRTTYAPAAPGGRGRRPLVFVFGGSAAWGHGVRDAETLPSWLARVAEARDAPLEVRNYAESSWVNWQCIAYLLRKLAQGERPDLVVFDSGVNEVLSGLKWPKEFRPIADVDFYTDAMSDSDERDRRPLFAAWHYYRATSLTLSTLFPQATSSNADAEPVRPVALARKIADGYLEDVSVVEALGREYGFSSLFVWQPIVADKKALTAQERSYAAWLPASASAVPAVAGWALSKYEKDVYEEVGSEVVHRNHVISLSDVFEGMTTSAFIDWIHPSEAGNERIATALYGRLPPRVTAQPAVQR